jgi:hypothetical protein
MKKFMKTLGFILGGGVVLALLLVLFLGISSLQTTENNVREQAYAEGQIDALNNDVSFVKLVNDGETDIDKGRQLAYAQGLEDAFDGDIRIKAVNDSTFVWTKNPWDKKTGVPKDTILIKNRSK